MLYESICRVQHLQAWSSWCIIFVSTLKLIDGHRDCSILVGIFCTFMDKFVSNFRCFGFVEVRCLAFVERRVLFDRKIILVASGQPVECCQSHHIDNMRTGSKYGTWTEDFSAVVTGGNTFTIPIADL